VAAETFAAAVKILSNGSQAGAATIIEACQFYVKNGVQRITKKLLTVTAKEFIISRRDSDVCKEYENQCRVALRALLKSLPAESTELPETKALKDASSNPFLDIPKFKAKKKPVVIYTPPELHALMGKVSNGVKTYIAVAAFAGLRRAQIYRLDWKE
jgi:integrase